MLKRRAQLPQHVSVLATQRLVREYVNEAVRLRVLAASVTTARIRARLLEEAANQERLARQVKTGGFVREVGPALGPTADQHPEPVS